MTNSDFHRSADIVDPDFVESVEVQTEYEKGWAAGQVALQSLCDQACQLALADELEIAALKERVKELRMRLTGGAAQSAQVRAKTIEECASHLEQKADLLTNSLHCGDNSATIAAAHKKSRQLYEAAAIINELAFAAQPPAAPVETEQSLRPLKAVEPVEVGFATGPQCSADSETEIKCTDCGVTGFDEHKPGCRGIRQQQYVPSAELRAATEQQPVYYRYRTKLHGGDWMVVRPDDLPKDKSGWEIEPLYRAVPQPAAVPDLDTAWQWDGKELLHDTPDWVAENTEQTWSSLSLAGFTGGITAFTSFGKARLKKGDWLVRHEGEIHAVKDAVYSALSRPESK